MVLLVAAIAGCARGSNDTEAFTPAKPSRSSRPSPVDYDDAPTIRSFDWQRSLGLAELLPSHELVFAAPAESLASGTLVTLVWLDEPQQVTHARVLGHHEQAWEIANAPVEGTVYDLHSDDPTPESGGYAIAIAGVIGEPEVDAGKVSIDLDGDGHRETFRQCASAEGLHFTIWSGPALESPQAWHRYLYLGMDLEPTCTDAEAGAH